MLIGLLKFLKISSYYKMICSTLSIFAFFRISRVAMYQEKVTEKHFLKKSANYQGILKCIRENLLLAKCQGIVREFREKHLPELQTMHRILYFSFIYIEVFEAVPLWV